MMDGSMLSRGVGRGLEEFVTGCVNAERETSDMRLHTLPHSCRQQKLAEVEKHETLASHPNCLRFVNAWEERGLLHIQTELCQMRCVPPPPPPPPHPSLSL